MSLFITRRNIRTIAEGIDLLTSYYDKRWEDTIDSVPTYITAKIVKAHRNTYEIDFRIVDKVSDTDAEFEAVSNDTLVIFKNFFNQLYSEGLVDYTAISYDPFEDNQLIGWEAKAVKVYDSNSNCN